MNNHFDPAKWVLLSPFEQLGNIGSEVGRAMNAIKREDPVALEGAFYRGLDLIDATVDGWSSTARRRELLRARELFSSAVLSNRVDPSLDAYFMQYAIAARAGL